MQTPYFELVLSVIELLILSILLSFTSLPSRFKPNECIENWVFFERLALRTASDRRCHMILMLFHLLTMVYTSYISLVS